MTAEDFDRNGGCPDCPHTSDATCECHCHSGERLRCGKCGELLVAYRDERGATAEMVHATTLAAWCPTRHYGTDDHPDREWDTLAEVTQLADGTYELRTVSVRRGPDEPAR